MTKTNQKSKSTNVQIITGTVIANPKGFGFVEQDGDGGDIYLPVYEMSTVLHGDKVKVEAKLQRRSGKLRGKVIKVLQRAHKRLTGVVCQNRHTFHVQPLDKRISHDILLPKNSAVKFKQGDIVEVEIVQYPGINKKLKADVINNFGGTENADRPVTLALHKHLIPYLWSEQAQKAASQCPDRVHDNEIESRTDLRSLNFITIDGETARDFDDAVYVSKHSHGFKLYVAIADVSHYIKANSVLDNCAYERGTSVYFPNRVVPMLPQEYSNGICSLNPDVDRLSLVCEINLNDSGDVKDYRFYEAVIRSKARLTYTVVWQYLCGQLTNEIDAENGKLLTNAYQLFHHLLELRKQRGALDLDIPDVPIIVDKHNNVQLVKAVPRNDAHRLIEEFMLLANVCAAQTMLKAFNFGLFRVHETPDAERVSELRYFLSELSLELPGGDKPSSHDFVKVFKNPAMQEQWRYIISTMMLRAQKQARYSEQQGIHFALNYESYTHFTSPIRRYPDLIVHRLLKTTINKTKSSKQLLHNLPLIAESCSVTERRAEKAYREVISYYKLKYLKDKIGDCFDAIITGVSAFGFFAELSEVMTSGLVHVTSLTNDFFIFNPLKQQLIGEKTGKILKIGNKIRVRVSQVDLDDKKLDLLLIDEQEKSHRKQEKRSRNKTRKPRN